MSKWFNRVAISLLAALIVLGLVPPSQSQASAKFYPAESAVFNHPTGAGYSVAVAKAGMSRIFTYMDNTPKGATIWMSLYDVTYDEFATKVIATKNRGVNIKILMDKHREAEGNTIPPAYQRLLNALGSDRSKGSFLYRCVGSCVDGSKNRGTRNHSKLFAFSKVGEKTGVVVIGSGNPTDTNVYSSQNEWQTVIRPGIYSAVKKYMEKAVKDTGTPSLTSASSGPYSIWLWPEGPGTQRHVMTETINRTNCSAKIPKSFGTNGKTQIRLAMFTIATSNGDLIDALIKKHREGCNVAALLNYDTPTDGMGGLNQTIPKSFVIKLQRAGIPVYNGRKKTYGMHLKTLIIRGNWNKQLGYVAISGSKNATNGSLYNDEQALRVYGAPGTEGGRVALSYWHELPRWTQAASLMPPLDSKAKTKSSAPNGDGGSDWVDENIDDL